MCKAKTVKSIMEFITCKSKMFNNDSSKDGREELGALYIKFLPYTKGYKFEGRL